VVQAAEAMYAAAREAVAAGSLPLFIGGDHSVSAGTIGGATHSGRSGVLWIDAHGDFNTPETSPSGNIHGMPLAALVGQGAPELVNLGRPGAKLRNNDVAMIGLRDLDDAEKVALRGSGIALYTMRDIDDRGIADIARQALRDLAHLDRIHVSLDMDSLDPDEAPGVGTPVPGGLTYREAHYACEEAARSGRLLGMDIVELNPTLDEHNRTGQLAVELILSALGKTIL
jgi:arginase